MREGTITFLPVQYQENKNSTPYDPISNSLWENKGFEEHYAKMYRDNWRLVSVQPLLRGMYETKTSGPVSIFTKAAWALGYGYSLTAGYYLFWEKDVEN